MLTRFDGGFGGFSMKRGDPAVAGDVEDPEPMRLLDRHGPDRAGDVCALLAMHVDEGAIVHLVDVVAGQDQHELRVPVGDEVQVLEDGVGRAAIPVARPPTADERLEQRDAAAAAVEVPRPADADVVDQGAGRVLGQDARRRSAPSSRRCSAQSR